MLNYKRLCPANETPSGNFDQRWTTKNGRVRTFTLYLARVLRVSAFEKERMCRGTFFCQGREWNTFPNVGSNPEDIT